MKVDIYYFTGTGNSLAIAKKIKDKLDDCKLIPIKKEIYKKIINIESKNIGIVFPTYFSNTPPIVLNFINKANFDKSEYIFAVSTAGGMAGYSFDSINNVLKKKNKKLSLEYKISMPGNYIIPWYYKFANRSDKGKKRLYKKAGKQIKNLVNLINDKKEKKYKFTFLLEKKVSTDLLAYSQKQNFKEWDKDYYSDNKCNSCGICEKICPVQNIKMQKGKPEWHNNCQLCMACIQLCPKESIQYKEDTINKKRYHHPEVKLNELLNA